MIKNSIQQLKRQILRETVLQFIILYTNIEKEKYYTIDEIVFLREPCLDFNPSFPGLSGRHPQHNALQDNGRRRLGYK